LFVRRYYRDLIQFRLTGDPAALLRTINPREAALFDKATGKSASGSTASPQGFRQLGRNHCAAAGAKKKRNFDFPFRY
jgi:hypothetical protein